MADKYTNSSSEDEDEDSGKVVPISTRKPKPKTKARVTKLPQRRQKDKYLLPLDKDDFNPTVIARVKEPAGVVALRENLGLDSIYMLAGFDKKHTPPKARLPHRMDGNCGQRHGQFGSEEDRAGWGPFDEAIDILCNQIPDPEKGKGFWGLGLAACDGIAVGDFDGILDKHGKEKREHVAYDRLQQCKERGAYIEYSSSKTGLHAVFKTTHFLDCAIGQGKDSPGGLFELFSNKGYFVVITGHIYQGHDGKKVADLTDMCRDLQRVKDEQDAERKERVERGRSKYKKALSLIEQIEEEDLTEQEVEERLDELKLTTVKVRRDLLRALKKIPPDYYPVWTEVGFAMQGFGYDFGGEDSDLMEMARQDWLDWSAGSPKFDQAQAEMKWSQLSRRDYIEDPKSYKSIFYMAQRVERGLPPLEKMGSVRVSVGEEITGEYGETISLQEFLLLAGQEVDWVIRKLLYAEVALMQGAGGSNKTTIALLLCVHIILGLPFLGYEITRPGPCVYITKEDSQIGLYKKLEKVFSSMGKLTDEDKEKVLANLHIKDRSDTPGYRFVLNGKNGNLRADSETIESLIEEYEDIGTETYKKPGPVLIVVDPAINFGAGESRVNDAENALVTSVRAITRRLNCTLMFLHHVGKDNFKNVVISAYGGRGGSAFADGARMVWTVVKSKLPDVWEVNDRGQSDAKYDEYGASRALWKRCGLPNLEADQIGLSIFVGKNSELSDYERKSLFMVRTPLGFRKVEPSIKDVPTVPPLRSAIIEALGGEVLNCSKVARKVKDQLEKEKKETPHVNTIRKEIMDMIGDELILVSGEQGKRGKALTVALSDGYINGLTGKEKLKADKAQIRELTQDGAEDEEEDEEDE